MGLNVSKGNMYGFVTHTWNTVKGICPHDCVYCYMKVFSQKPRRFDRSELKTHLGEDNNIFVGSSNDLFAADVPEEWIIDTLRHCKKYGGNSYLLQSKNPQRFREFAKYFPDNVVLCTTIETNRENDLANAPSRGSRAEAIRALGLMGYETQVTIEPIMDFDPMDFFNMLTYIEPSQINIGADSKEHHLPEPSSGKVQFLIKLLVPCYELILKPNLERFRGG